MLRETPKVGVRPAEAGALLVSAKDLLAPLWRIGVRVGILAALPAAIMAEALLFTVWSLAVLEDVFAVTVIAGDDSSNHSSILSAWSHYRFFEASRRPLGVRNSTHVVPTSPLGIAFELTIGQFLFSALLAVALLLGVRLTRRGAGANVRVRTSIAKCAAGVR